MSGRTSKRPRKKFDTCFIHEPFFKQDLCKYVVYSDGVIEKLIGDIKTGIFVKGRYFLGSLAPQVLIPVVDNFIRENWTLGDVMKGLIYSQMFNNIFNFILGWKKKV